VKANALTDLVDSYNGQAGVHAYAAGAFLQEVTVTGENGDGTVSLFSQLNAGPIGLNILRQNAGNAVFDRLRHSAPPREIPRMLLKPGSAKRNQLETRTVAEYIYDVLDNGQAGYVVGLD
jgi:hypothetical protein